MRFNSHGLLISNVIHIYFDHETTPEMKREVSGFFTSTDLSLSVNFISNHDILKIYPVFVILFAVLAL